MSEPIRSIVQVFQSSKPRTKLFVQRIPPGYTEDEFKELIKKFEDQIDYFLFRPGKIIRDHYGHLIGLDNLNFGYALVNFKNPRICPKFHRDFNGHQVTDLHNIKSSLVVEFAVNQEVFDASKSKLSVPKSIEFRSLPIFQEFLKTYPFAAKVEEERLLANRRSIELDLENLNSHENEISGPIKGTELDSKLLLPASPTALEPILISYSSIMKRSNAMNSSSSDSIVTPLTKYIKDLSLNSSLPAPKNSSRAKKNKKQKKKQQNPQNEFDTQQQSSKNKTKKESRRTKKKQNHNEKDLTSDSNPQIKGVPKILARKTEAPESKPESEAKPPVELNPNSAPFNLDRAAKTEKKASSKTKRKPNDQKLSKKKNESSGSSDMASKPFPEEPKLNVSNVEPSKLNQKPAKQPKQNIPKAKGKPKDKASDSKDAPKETSNGPAVTQPPRIIFKTKSNQAATSESSVKENK